jgi:hypothetical protein
VNVNVIDNFYPVPVWDRAVALSEASRFRFFWQDIDGYFYWNLPIGGNDPHRSRITNASLALGEPINYEDPIPSSFSQIAFQHLWEDFKNHFPTLDVHPYSVYANLHTFGTEGFPHQDSTEDSCTVITYLNRFWDVRWGGATAFYDKMGSFETEDWPQQAEYKRVVVPKANRVIIFDSRIPHGVIPLSRIFTGARITLMYKIDVPYGTLIKHWEQESLNPHPLKEHNTHPQ